MSIESYDQRVSDFGASCHTHSQGFKTMGVKAQRQQIEDMRVSAMGMHIQYIEPDYKVCTIFACTTTHPCPVVLSLQQVHEALGQHHPNLDDALDKVVASLSTGCVGFCA